jgi:calcineurin-like phosphoesterase family protein
MLESGKIVRWWSDPHFGHDNVRRMCGRDFPDVTTMDAAIWGNVAATAACSDLVVCLGDLAFRNPAATPLDIQRRLAREFGDRQATVVGNHDAKGQPKPAAWAQARAFPAMAFHLPTALLRAWAAEDWGGLDAAIDWRELPDRIAVGCSHWPVYADRLPGPGWICLHGHIHQRRAGPLHVNASVEAIGYAPKELRELITPDLVDNLVRRQRGLPLLAEGAGDDGVEV